MRRDNLPRNVLHLVHGFYEGGSERQAVQLIRLLHERARYRVHVASLYGGGPLRAEVERLGTGDIPVYELTSFHDRNTITQLRRCARYLREHEIVLVHTHDFYSNIFGLAAATLARTPARIASRRETTGTRTPTQKRVERAAYRLADTVVANAAAVRAHLIAEGVRADKIEVIYNGLDLARVAPPAGARNELLASLKLPAGRRFVTIVANLRLPVKDHPTFLRAAQRVRAAVPDAAFVLAGEGELSEPLHALAAALGIARDTFFVGRCDQVAALLAVSDVCVLSSRAEGFSNALLEYMAAARPVVATDVGGARELIRADETGHLVAVGDDEQMAARIIALLADPERARAFGERGRRVVAEQFSCAAQVARVEQLYERLLAAQATAHVRHEAAAQTSERRPEGTARRTEV